MVCASFLQSSMKAKLLNSFVYIFSLLAWISCCVTFGGVMIKATGATSGSGAPEFDFYWNHVSSGGNSMSYSDLDGTDLASCNGAGKGTIAMTVFAFLGLTAVLALQTIRILGLPVRALEPIRKCLFFELVLTASNTFFFFLAVCIFGGGCFAKVLKYDAVSDVKGVGFGFMIACFFFLIIELIMVYLIRSDSTCHLGAAGASDDAYATSQGSTDYNPPVGSYQYNPQANAGAYGAYNGDVTVQPSASESNI